MRVGKVRGNKVRGSRISGRSGGNEERGYKGIGQVRRNVGGEVGKGNYGRGRFQRLNKLRNNFLWANGILL